MAPPQQKKKQVTMNLAEFHSFVRTEAPTAASVGSPSTNSWADEQFVLPDAPQGDAVDRPRFDETPRGRLRAHQQPASGPVPVIDHARLPRSPPFIAFVGNLPQVTQDDLKGFFKGMAVKGVKLPIDGSTGRQRGFGYVEFGSVEDLTRALLMSGQLVNGRPVRLDISDAKPQDSGSGRDQFGGGGAFQKNWREGHEVVSSSSLREPAAPADWRNKPHPAAPAAVAADWRSTTAPVTERDPNLLAQFNKNRPAKPKSVAGRSPSPVKRQPAQSFPEEQKERPQLKLAPRTKPIEGAAAASSDYSRSAKPNPFGAAKPKQLDDPALKLAVPRSEPSAEKEAS